MSLLECSNNVIIKYSLKILTGTLCHGLSHGKVLIMARVKELSNSQKALFVKLWRDRGSNRNILSNLNIPFTTIYSFIARFKRRNTVDNKKKNRCSNNDFTKITKKIRTPDLPKCKGYAWRATGRFAFIRMKCNQTNNKWWSLKSRRQKKTPLLLKRHRDPRLKFLRQHMEKENWF